MKAWVDVALMCEEQVENGDDEIYVSAGIAHSNGHQGNVVCWAGDMADDDDVKRFSGLFHVWDGEIAAGERATITVNVVEQDGDNHGPGLDLAVKIAQTAGAAIAAGLGAPEVAAAIQAFDFSQYVNDSDDYPGSFTIYLIGLDNGQIESRVYPTWRARFLDNGRLQLDGDGSRYYPGVDVNGVRVGQGPTHFSLPAISAKQVAKAALKAKTLLNLKATK